jgi:hypothetical protein
MIHSARLSALSLLLLALAACGTTTPPPAAVAPAPVAAVPAPIRPSWVRPDLDLHWLAADGSVQYPPNDGFLGTPVQSTLQPGRLIDRFGGSGRYFSPKGEPFGARALPSVCEAQTYTVYRVVKPLPVESGKAVPWFDEPGGATQYETQEASAALVSEGVLVPVPDAGPAPCG